MDCSICLLLNAYWQINVLVIKKVFGLPKKLLSTPTSQRLFFLEAFELAPRFF